MHTITMCLSEVESVYRCLKCLDSDLAKQLVGIFDKLDYDWSTGDSAKVYFPTHQQYNAIVSLLTIGTNRYI